MAKTWAMIFGWVFLLVGILGFFSNPIIGANGYFLTDTLHNIVHLLFGVILLWVAYGMPMKSAGALKVSGVIYLILAILGFLTISGMGSLLGLVLMNTADSWLHLVLGIGMLWAGIAGGKKMGAQM